MEDIKMYCTNCGAKIEDSAAFCPYCGTPARNREQIPPVTEPPEILYHGTAERFSASIEAKGLLPQNRLYVHLSPDTETAEKVGRRHGKPIIYLINAGQMRQDGYTFLLSANGVWLTKMVPAQYLKRLGK